MRDLKNIEHLSTVTEDLTAEMFEERSNRDMVFWGKEIFCKPSRLCSILIVFPVILSNIFPSPD
jgi:hypothetical protein